MELHGNSSRTSATIPTIPHPCDDRVTGDRVGLRIREHFFRAGDSEPLFPQIMHSFSNLLGWLAVSWQLVCSYC